MALQRFYGGKVLGKFGFGEGRMDFVVTDLMQKNGLPAFAAAQLWNEVVEALFGMGRDWPLAQGADRDFHRGCGAPFSTDGAL